ncbi:globin-like protein [Lipomyces oligophaga]|uniref:globin-like protein n=1 Tax=Lipomyces oligophaga TaxID=45792 RepID=UPI0034CD4885
MTSVSTPIPPHAPGFAPGFQGFNPTTPTHSAAGLASRGSASRDSACSGTSSADSSFSAASASSASTSASSTTSVSSGSPKCPASPPQIADRPSYTPTDTIELTADDAIAVRETYNETIGLSPLNNVSTSMGSPANLFYSQFYQNLFVLHPDLEFMFPDVQRQSAAISGIFSAALAMIDNIHVLDDLLERLGHRHAYVMGIEPEHFELVGVVFIQTLRDRLGDRFTPSVEATWVKIYTYLAGKMVDAGRDNSTSKPSGCPVSHSKSMRKSQRASVDASACPVGSAILNSSVGVNSSSLSANSSLRKSSVPPPTLVAVQPHLSTLSSPNTRQLKPAPQGVQRHYNNQLTGTSGFAGMASPAVRSKAAKNRGGRASAILAARSTRKSGDKCLIM